MHAGDQQAAEQRARVVALRVAGLLGDVDGVLEADQRVERQRRAREDRGDDALALLELERAAGVAAAVAERGDADDDDEQQAAELDRSSARRSACTDSRDARGS